MNKEETATPRHRKPNDGKAMPTFEDDLNQFRAEFERFDFVVEDVKRYFGLWDMYDPVVWAILRVVEAQNNLADAYDQSAAYGTARVVEQAIAERREAIAALQKALEEAP